jgi:hypothetical protein
VGGNFVREWETGGGDNRVQVTLNARPSPRWALMLEPALERVGSPWQFVGTVAGDPDDTHVVARLAQTTGALTTRASYTLTPELTLELYAQPFGSTGRYSDYRSTDRPRARRFEDRFAVLEGSWAGPAPNFDVREYNANLVARWEYRPGSVVYLVWSHQTRSMAGASPGSRVAVKASYWFGGR